MDVFSYVTLGLVGLLLLAWGLAWLIAMLRDSHGRAVLLLCAVYVLDICTIISTAWLIGTKLI